MAKFNINLSDDDSNELERYVKVFLDEKQKVEDWLHKELSGLVAKAKAELDEVDKNSLLAAMKDSDKLKKLIEYVRSLDKS